MTNPAGLKAWAERRFPESTFFDNTIAEGKFPSTIATFMVSVQNCWTKGDQHAIYVVFGDLALRRLQQGRASMTEEKYRDVRAGALQHFANGLCHVAEAASRNELVDLTFVLGGDQPLEALDFARKALHAQQQSACLRSEKYAKPGQSKSAYFSYKSALENLAKMLRATASLLDESDPEKPILLAMARQTLDKSTRLLLSDEVALEAWVAGEELKEYEQEISKDRSAAAVSIKCLKLGASTKPPPGIWLECARCHAKPPDMRGMTCKCLCVCRGCEPGDMVVECPECGDYNEFVSAA